MSSCQLAVDSTFLWQQAADLPSLVEGIRSMAVAEVIGRNRSPMARPQ